MNVNSDSEQDANVLKSVPVNVILCSAQTVKNTTWSPNVQAFKILLSAPVIVYTNAAHEPESIYTFPSSVKYAFDWILFGNLNTFLILPVNVVAVAIVISAKSFESWTPFGLVKISIFCQYEKLIPLDRNSFSDIPPYRLSLMNGNNLSFLAIPAVVR